MVRVTRLLVAASLVALAACSDPMRATSEPDAGSGTTDAGDVTDGGDTTDGGETTPAGTAGGACYGNGTCDAGLSCEAGTCVSGVAAGSNGGACYPNGTCNTGLVCSANTCAPGIAQGLAGGACYPNGTCNTGLECRSNTCSQPAAGPRCGNGVKEGSEECDGGGANSNSAKDACRTDCRKASCGDGVIDSNEECDGTAVANGSCVSCQVSCSGPVYDDCDGVAANGCETDLRSTASHCNVCNNVCTSGTCANRACGTTGATGSTTLYSQYLIRGIALAGANLYVGTRAAGQATARLVRVSVADGTATDEFPAANANNMIHGVVVDATTLYSLESYTASYVRRRPLFGGTVESLTSDLYNDYTKGVSDGTNLYLWGDRIVKFHLASRSTTVLSPTGYSGVAFGTSAAYTYWRSGGLIQRYAYDGTSSQNVADNQNTPSGVAVNASHVYWTTEFGGTVMRKALPGTTGTPETVATGEAGPRTIALGPTHALWLNGDGTLRKVPLAGGTPATVATGLGAATELLVDGTHAYVLLPGAWDDDQIRKIAY